MASTAAVTIAVVAAATARSIAVGPRVGLLRRRLETCWRTPPLQVLKPLGCCISSGPRAAPALSTHASGGVAPAGHLSLICHCARKQTQPTSMLGFEKPNFNADMRHTTTVTIYQELIGGPHTFDRSSVFGPPLPPVQSSLLQGAPTFRCLMMFGRCGARPHLFACVVSALGVRSSSMSTHRILFNSL